MNKEIEDNEWKELAPTLVAGSKTVAFNTPENYFNDLGSRINVSVFLSELKTEKEHSGFEVPKNYFENLNAEVNTAINLSEFADKSTPFAVPDNYFVEVRNRIQSKISRQPSSSRKRTLKLWPRLTRYAVAASILIVSSVGIYRYNHNNANVSDTPTLSELSNEQFLYDIDESTIIKNINDEHPAQIMHTSAKDSDVEAYLMNHYTANELAQDL